MTHSRKTHPTTSAPPRYTVKPRAGVLALYRNGRLCGLNVVILSLAPDAAVLEYDPAQPYQNRVTHRIPTELVTVRAAHAA